MPRAAVVTLLVAFILTGSLQAQRAGGMFQGHAGGMGVHSGFVGQRGSRPGLSPPNGLFPRTGSFLRFGFFPRPGFFPRSGVFARPGFFSDRFRFRNNGFDLVLVPYPYPYAEPFEYAPYPEAVASEPVSQVVMPQQQGPQSRVPEMPAAKPQMIEVPRAAGSAAAKPLPPTLFILKNGERLETRQFILTASKLSVSIGRQQRTIPFDLLDINATVTANRERGINLRIPADEHEISLSF